MVQCASSLSMVKIIPALELGPSFQQYYSEPGSQNLFIVLLSVKIASVNDKEAIL